MPCGCQSACGCDVVGDGVTAEVARLGDTFTVSSIQAIMGVADTDCIDLDVDPSKILRASPILSPDPSSVDLVCSGDGISGAVVVDPASTAIVTEGPAGLRVDVPPVPGGGGDWQPGDLIMHFGVGPRANAIDADGSQVPRAAYQDLWDALSLKATAATRTAGVAVVTDIPSTRFMAAGMPVEITSFPFGTTILSVDSSTTITASNPSGNSGSDTEVRVYPHGNGDGVSTFNTPDGNEVYPLGFDYTGGTNVLGDVGGSDTYSLGAGNLPLHDHPATVSGGVQSSGVNGTGITVATGSVDSGHDHPILDDGTHAHDGAGSNHDFIVENSSPAAYVYLDVVAVNVDTANTFRMTSNGVEGGLSRKPNREALTFPDGSHDHSGLTVSGSAVITSTSVVTDLGHTHPHNISVDVLDAGSATPTPVAIDPRHNVVRWMVHT